MESVILASVLGALFGTREWYRTMVLLYGRFQPTRAVMVGLIIKAIQWAAFGAAVGLIVYLLTSSRIF